MKKRLSSFYAKKGKSLLDYILVSLFITLSSPLMGLIAIAIKINSRGSIFFRQERVGLYNRVFVIHKFRTMYRDVPAYATKPIWSDDSRITPVGRWLRKTSLDELPQFFNVLKGEMSLVGPRPEMPFLAEQYEEWENQRYIVKPGLTGLWQLSPHRRCPIRNGIPLDLEYIENLSFWNDLKILMRTCKVFWDKNTY